MSAGNSAYSPLPQSNSDSDCSSEEELHVSQENRIVNRTSKAQNSKGEKTNNDKKNNINYNILDNDGDIGVALNKFHSAHDEVSIVKPDGGLEIFSTSRKICFAFSLLLCVFTTVAFIWILPCNVEPCPNVSDMKKYNFTWEENLPNIEIYGPISLALDQNGNSNLIFLTRSLLASDRNFFNNTLKCLKAKDGSLSWNFNLNDKPTDVDCQSIDLNADGVDDCLIYGRTFLKAINPISGTEMSQNELEVPEISLTVTGDELWDIQNSNENKLKLDIKDFPLVVTDVNEDKTKDFLLASSFKTDDKENYPETDTQNYLVIISGKTGKIINKPLQIKSCSFIKNLILKNSSALSYTCFNSDKKESYQRISLTRVLKTLKNPVKENINFIKLDLLKRLLRDSNTVSVNGFRLIIENHGDCPEDCDVLVDVRDEHESSKNKSVYSFNQKNTFGMAPVVLKTKNESGFILKLWKWISKTENSGFLKKVLETNFKQKLPNIMKRSKKSHHLLNNSVILDKEMISESEWESLRRKRTASKLIRNRFGRNVFKSSTSNTHWISENIIKIHLNESQVVVSNLTKDEIVQICNKPKACFPDALQQKNSVLIASLDGTENTILVTYTSTYVQQNKETKNKSKPWQLQSKVRILNI